MDEIERFLRDSGGADIPVEIQEKLMKLKRDNGNYFEDLKREKETAEEVYTNRAKETEMMVRASASKVMDFTNNSNDNSSLDKNGNPYTKQFETIWKNPKPGTPNKKLIQSGDLVLIDGLPIMQEVHSVQDIKDQDTGSLMVRISVDGSPKDFKSEDVHPLYIQDADKLKVGNVVYINHQDYPFIVSKIDGEEILTSNHQNFTKDSIDKIFGKTKKKEIYQKYSCGGITFKDSDYNTLAELKKDNPGIAFSVNNEEISLEACRISTHFNIPSEDLSPKEVEIEKLLKTALDHPLNVADKEWALVVGPSGSGKTEMAVKYAKDKKLEYVKQQGHSHLSGDDLIGYESITDGTYFRSLLREAVEHGQLYILDEIDACNPNTLLILNGLKQEYFQFPDELVKIHKNFRLIATANTLEYSEEYNARAPMDKATKARFDIITYDMKGHELALRYGLKYIKEIEGAGDIDKLSPRDVSRLVNKIKIKEEEAA